MYTIPTITPLCNLEESTEILKEIRQYKAKNWAIGQLFPDGGPDKFSYFFSIRGITIFNYLRGNISMGEPSAYDKNIKNMIEYINYSVAAEVELIDKEIKLIKEYESKNWAIGELFPDGGVDSFVIFFAQRHLPIFPYLRGTVDIGEPTAYCKNIDVLSYYKDRILSFLILTK